MQLILTIAELRLNSDETWITVGTAVMEVGICNSNILGIPTKLDFFFFFYNICIVSYDELFKVGAGSLKLYFRKQHRSADQSSSPAKYARVLPPNV